MPTLEIEFQTQVSVKFRQVERVTKQNPFTLLYSGFRIAAYAGDK